MMLSFDIQRMQSDLDALIPVVTKNTELANRAVKLGEENLKRSEQHTQQINALQAMLDGHFADLDQRMQTWVDDIAGVVQGVSHAGRIAERIGGWLRPRWVKITAFGAAVVAAVESLKHLGK
jgi:hypothetical protein